MAYIYSYSVDGKKINETFPGCIPCNCFNDSNKQSKKTTYSVSMSFGNIEYGAKGKLITELIVTCNCCNHMKSYNVENSKILQSDIHW